MNKKDIKEQYKSVLDLLEEHKETDDCKDKRMAQLAITYSEIASMCAVASCFSKEERDQH